MEQNKIFWFKVATIFTFVLTILIHLPSWVYAQEATPQNMIDPAAAKMVITIEGLATVALIVTLIVLAIKMNRKEPATLGLLGIVLLGIIVVGGVFVKDCSRYKEATVQVAP